jgi:hypothetical protein
MQRFASAALKVYRHHSLCRTPFLTSNYTRQFSIGSNSFAPCRPVEIALLSESGPTSINGHPRLGRELLSMLKVINLFVEAKLICMRGENLAFLLPGVENFSCFLLLSFSGSDL